MGQVNPFENSAAYRVSLDLSADFAAHMSAVESDLRPALVSHLAPYQASFRLLTGRRMDLAGDEPAVVILQRWIEAAAEAWQAGTTPNRLWSPEQIETTLDQTLQRDLAFRVSGLRKAVRPMSVMQHAFMDALLDKTPPILIGAGPTGTGKTHLAIAAGIDLVEEGKFKHLVIARPHLFETGDEITREKRADTTYDDQFAAIEDELNDLIGPDEVRTLTKARRLEVMPLGRMRGRTFQNTFVIIDEAQNMSVSKTRMAVTRLGADSRIVLTGDPAHVEMRDEGRSGFEHLMAMVEDKPHLARIFRFTPRQIVRNPVVAELEALYESHGGGTY